MDVVVHAGAGEMERDQDVSGGFNSGIVHRGNEIEAGDFGPSVL